MNAFWTEEEGIDAVRKDGGGFLLEPSRSVGVGEHLDHRRDITAQFERGQMAGK